jgi:hypothetical protein
MTFTKDVDLPKEIPPVRLSVSRGRAMANIVPQGNYQVLADVFTKDGDKITCLKARVSFSRN